MKKVMLMRLSFQETVRIVTIAAMALFCLWVRS